MSRANEHRPCLIPVACRLTRLRVAAWSDQPASDDLDILFATHFTEKERLNPMSRESPGPLRNGNPRGNPHAAPRCGSRTRAGGACRQPAMGNGRCRLHGGQSTGPRTEAGLAAVAAAHTTHGLYGGDNRDYLRRMTAMLREGRAFLASLKDLPLPTVQASTVEAVAAPPSDVVPFRRRGRLPASARLGESGARTVQPDDRAEGRAKPRANR